MADPRWLPFSNLTSSAYVADPKGDIFQRIICPPSFVVIALIFSEVGAESAPPPVPKDPKKPGLNRVKTWFKRRTRHVYCQTPYYLFGPQ